MIRVLLLLFLISPFGFANPEEECANTYEMIARAHVSESVFNDERPLRVYKEMLCCGFAEAVAGLQPGDIYLDVGSGRGFALAEVIQDYLPKKRLFGGARADGGKPVGIGISVVMKKDKYVQQVVEANPKNLKYITNTFVEDIPNKDLGRPKIITDLYGALSYTDDVGRVLQKYLDILRDDGQIFLNVGYSGRTVFLKDGQRLSFADFLASIPGLEVHVGKEGEIAVSKTTSQVQLPKLKLKSFQKKTPPAREFEVVPAIASFPSP